MMWRINSIDGYLSVEIVESKVLLTDSFRNALTKLGIDVPFSKRLCKGISYILKIPYLQQYLGVVLSPTYRIGVVKNVETKIAYRRCGVIHVDIYKNVASVVDIVLYEDVVKFYKPDINMEKFYIEIFQKLLNDLKKRNIGTVLLDVLDLTEVKKYKDLISKIFNFEKLNDQYTFLKLG